jgi:hypothetical protein
LVARSFFDRGAASGIARAFVERVLRSGTRGTNKQKETSTMRIYSQFIACLAIFAVTACGGLEEDLEHEPIEETESAISTVCNLPYGNGCYTTSSGSLPYNYLVGCYSGQRATPNNVMCTIVQNNVPTTFWAPTVPSGNNLLVDCKSYACYGCGPTPGTLSGSITCN